MHIYLSKKIPIPNNAKVNCVSWNTEDGFMAVGGEGGFLRVIKFAPGLTAANKLSMNQTLEGHSENVRVITWNQKHKKLTTSDDNGIIIMWMLYKGTWCEEMISNRKKSVVVGMSWSSDGSKICIIYEDGAVIVGSVDGNRIWGKELKSIPLTKVQWSPDGKLLLFGLKNGRVHLYDNLGNFIMPIEMQCFKACGIPMIPVSIVDMDWYNGKYGHIYALCPTLVICFENGYMQLMCNESDPGPVVVQTRMTATCCCWNHNGSLLAVAGRQISYVENKSNNVVQLYNPFGEHLRTLKLPGQIVSSCSWEERSLTIALGIGSSVYFANIRPDYKWCYFKNTVVFTPCRLQKAGVCISFWDIANNKCHIQFVPVLLALAAYGDHCVLATRLDTDNPLGQYSLVLCNTLGTPVDRKYTNIEIKYVAMNNTYVIAASKNNYFLWQYKTPKSACVSTRDSKCEIHHIDYDPHGAILARLHFKVPERGGKDSNDPICCIAASDKYLIIGRESGTIKQFTVPYIIAIHTYTPLPIRPHKISINCDSTRLSVIDMAGVLAVLDITQSTLKYIESNENTRLERKNVWAMCWASDDPQLFAIMEKTRMYVFKGIYPEEPISSTGYICSFQNLEIQAVLLDQVMEAPEKPAKEHFLKLEVKSLRDTRQLLEEVGINEAAQFIEDNPHSRLWHLLGETALKDLNLKMAEDAFIRFQNYSGIQFVKKLQGMTNDTIRKASVAAYFKNFDEAEKLFIEADRRDLALNLRETLGDWFGVMEIMMDGRPFPTKLLEVAYNRTADYFAHINDWAEAAYYYELAANKKRMIESYFHIQEYKAVETIMEELEDSNPLLRYIAKMFIVEGDFASAIRAYLKLGDVQTAILVSVEHNYWDQAIYLAKKYSMNQVANFFMEYSERLVKVKKVNKAVEINVQAKYWFTAAKYAIKLADEESKKINRDPMKIKRMYVYAGRLIELYKKEPTPEEVVDTWADADLLENGWKGAEAFHFYMLAQRQIHNSPIHDAVCTLVKLQDYMSLLPPVKVYSLLALASCLDGAYGICNKMFVKLNSLPEMSDEDKDEYQKLAQEIFTSEYRVDLQHRKKYSNCFNCQSSVCDWETFCPNCDVQFPSCVASGRSVISHHLPTITCTTCHHVAIEVYLGLKKMCPLCHSPLNNEL